MLWYDKIKSINKNKHEITTFIFLQVTFWLVKNYFIMLWEACDLMFLKDN